MYRNSNKRLQNEQEFEENENQKAQGKKEYKILHRVLPSDIDTNLFSQSGSFLRRGCTEIAVSDYRANEKGGRGKPGDTKLKSIAASA